MRPAIYAWLTKAASVRRLIGTFPRGSHGLAAPTARRVPFSVEAALVCWPPILRQYKDAFFPRRFSNNSFPPFVPSSSHSHTRPATPPFVPQATLSFTYSLLVPPTGRTTQAGTSRPGLVGRPGRPGISTL
jgi:hypothetical protein